MKNQHSENILVVDDNPVNNQLIATYLLPCGYTIQVAENGKEGIRLARESKPDLILLDVMMPDMDGYEVCRVLRDNPETADIPILFITADASPDSHMLAFSVGGNDFITKPVYEVVLLARVDNLINLFKSKKRLEELNKHHQLSQKISQTGHWSYQQRSGQKACFRFSQQLHDLLDPGNDCMQTWSIEDFIDCLTEDCGDRERILKTWTKAQNSASDFREIITCRINGCKKNIRVWAQFSVSSDMLSIFGSVQDITGLMAIIYEESKLENTMASNDRYNSMVESGTQLAHELNQPLASITLNVNAARMFLQSDPIDKNELFDIVKDVESEVMRAKEVVERMRKVASRKPLMLEHFDINELISKTARIFARDFHANNINLVQNKIDVPCFISGDKLAVQQILVNVIRNAYEALIDGNVENPRIVINTIESPEEISIFVSDNGPGVPDALSKNLFAPFITTKPNNLGLGLAICKSIVTRLEGTIALHHLPDQVGTCLCIFIPRERSVM